MNLKTMSLVFATLAILLLPIALNGCGTDTSNDDTTTRHTNRGIYVLGVGYSTDMPASITGRIGK